MSAVRVNFSDVESFEPIPVGVYPVRFIDVEEAQSEGGEFPYYKCTMEITDERHLNRKLFVNLSLSPKAAWKLKEALIAFGETEETLAGEFDLDIAAYLQAECFATVTQRNYEGRMVNNVQALHASPPQVRRAGGSAGPPATGKAAGPGTKAATGAVPGSARKPKIK